MTIKEFVASPFRVFATLDVLLIVGVNLAVVICSIIYGASILLLLIPSLSIAVVFALPFMPYEHSRRFKDMPRGILEGYKIIWKLYGANDRR